LIPDKETMMKHPGSHHGIVMSKFINYNNTSYTACPRNLLEKAYQKLFDFGFKLKVGFEV
jgi:glutamine synthetase